MALATENKGVVVRKILTTKLKKLSERQFEKFKDVLCETSMKELVDKKDEFLNKPNTFQRDASLEKIVEDLIAKFGRTHAVTAAATVMKKIEERELLKELEGEEEGLKVTDPGLERKPKGREIGKGLVGIASGAVIGATSLGVAAAATTAAPFAISCMCAFFGGALVIKGVKRIFPRN